MQVDRQWYGTPLLWTRDDASGVWHPTEHLPTLPKAALTAAPAAAAAAPAPAAAANGNAQQGDDSTAATDQTPAANGASSPQGDVHPIVLAARARMQQSKHEVAPAAEAVTTMVADAAGVSSESSGGFREDVEEKLKNCLVLVDVDIPLVALSDGVHARSFAGNGLVMYHGDNLGLVLVSCAGAGAMLQAVASCVVMHHTGLCQALHRSGTQD